jgi:hypothetical protein
MSKGLWAASALAAVVCWLPLSADAQSVAAPAPQPYRPGLGDLMTMTVQPRHIKLWAGGQARNWAYAAYELHELEESFERAARSWPQWRSHPIAEMVETLTKQPMDDLSAAIKGQDPARFTAAYARLTDACNSCHQATDRGIVAIRVPEAASFPDQDFRPPKP